MRNIPQGSSANGDDEASYWRGVTSLLALEDLPFQTVQEAVDGLCQEIVQITGARAMFVPSSQQETNGQTSAFPQLVCRVYSKRKIYGKLVVFSCDDHSAVPALSAEIATALATICCRVLSHVEDRLIIQGQYKQFDLAACEPLTPQEEKILSLLAQKHNIQDIAQSLCISPYTVNTHKHHAYRKLNVHSQSEAIIVARVLNIL